MTAFSQLPLYNPYKFSAYATGTTSLSANTQTLVPLNAVTFDTSSNFNTSSYEFIAPVGGFYQFNWYGYQDVGGTATYWVLNLYKNGSYTVSGSNYDGTGYLDSVGTTLLKLNATDYIQIYAEVGTSQTLAAGAVTLQGFLLSLN